MAPLDNRPHSSRRILTHLGTRRPPTIVTRPHTSWTSSGIEDESSPAKGPSHAPVLQNLGGRHRGRKRSHTRRWLRGPGLSLLPERPKPFLDLFPDGTLFQKTVRRLLGPASTWTSRTSRSWRPGATRHWPATSGPASTSSWTRGPEHDRRGGPGDHPHRSPRDEVMAVLPADHAIGREGLPAAPLGGARHRRVSFGVRDPLVTLGIQVDRPATEYGYLVPDIDLGADIDGLQAYPLEGFEEKPTPTGRANSSTSRAWPGTPGCSSGGAGRSGRAQAATELLRRLEPALGDRPPSNAPMPTALDLDRLRGDGAGGPDGRRRHGGHGRRLERHRRLDRPPRRHRGVGDRPGRAAGRDRRSGQG